MKHHKKGRTDSAMSLRTLYYPPLSNFEVKEQQVRCGEHTDFGSISLLFQQRAGLLVWSELLWSSNSIMDRSLFADNLRQKGDGGGRYMYMYIIINMNIHCDNL